MIDIVVKYLQNKLDDEAIFQKNYGLTDLVNIEGKIFPLFYEGNGKYKQEFSPNKWFGVSYFRKNGDVSFSGNSFVSYKPCEVPISIKIPLTFVCSIKKDKLDCDNNYASDKLGFYVSKIFEDINGLKVELKAKRVEFNVSSYNTDAFDILDKEFSNVGIVFNPLYCYLSINLDVLIQTSKGCMFDYCEGVIIDQNTNKVADQNKNNLKS